MAHDALFFTLALIFSGAALLATFALLARQSLVVAYILMGFVLGPWGLSWVGEPMMLQKISNIGIVFLLFLLGLNLTPQKLVPMLRDAARITFFSSLAFFSLSFLIAFAFGFRFAESCLIGICMTFSSTILGLKLLPSSELYRERPGEIIISVLLLQDIAAIAVLLGLEGLNKGEIPIEDMALLMLALPGTVVAAFLMQRYLIDPLVTRFDSISEYVFLMALGWCLGLAALAEQIGLSAEVGAFIAGVAMASSPTSRYISRRLRPLRDFFLILFFFSIGASLNLNELPDIWLPSLCIAVSLLIAKPWVFRLLLDAGGEKSAVSNEVGLRLGQASEFALLVSVLAIESQFLTDRGLYVIQFTTVLTFVVSSYVISRKLPTPGQT